MTFVVIGGLPGAGNTMLAGLLRQCPGCRVDITHGYQDPFVARFRHADRCIVPVRNPRLRRLSAVRSKHPDAVSQEQEDHLTRVVLASAMQHGIPVRLVSYEAVCLDPQVARDDLLKWCGLHGGPRWPDIVHRDRLV